MSRGLKISDLIIPDPAPTSSDDDLESSGGWSLTSSVTDYVYENGRRYPGFGPDGAYLYPNDDRENERLDLQHHVFRLLKGGDLHTIPNAQFKNAKVLDVGTGTGIWAIDFADEYPEAKIRGIDLSPTQPEWVPENVVFEIDNLEDQWNFTSKFDYIHMRMMLGSIANWPLLIKQAFENLSPGGWLESQEVLTCAYCDDGTLPPDCNWKKWEKLYVDAAREFGRPIDIAMDLKGWYEEAGFVDVVEEVVKCPLGNWPADRGQKENGRYLRTSLSEGLQALSLATFTRVLGWKADEVEALTALCRNDLNNRAYHGYFKFYFVRGRKPEEKKPVGSIGRSNKWRKYNWEESSGPSDFRSSSSTLDTLTDRRDGGNA
ncbi:hypothetical protein DRE_02234 [Drechslerella stenobrocha 248]|uniref:S-adenosyl-L-methionine-dependent methyltransferase n=1 Tax=Drechslerella stenobrocha 248 TaxID=1043628 RepID=W7IGY8_9PEZI|nr:hypothetical protein DRE_02234 [Drechslerella stenobrocha 248]